MTTIDTVISFSLSVRADRPIEGCELSPSPFLQQKGNGSDLASRARLLDSNAYYYTFSWRRGPRQSGCANPSCPRGCSFEPLQWCRAAIGGPELLCNVCITAGYPSYESSFCSKQCFTSAWKEHSIKHRSYCKSSSFSESSSPAEGDENPAGADLASGFGIGIGNGGFSNAATSSAGADASTSWPIIYEDKTYTPTSQDIGCRLRIEVWAMSPADNSIIAGPAIFFTEPVLSMPSKPPKRKLQAISGSGAGIAAAVRFRVVSYNVLAEIYATRQAYPYCDMWNLAWPYRRKMLFEELEEIQGDIVCLQEVQADHYEADIGPYMTSLGYDGIYKPKSREFMGQYGKVDGCATFWKKSKFMMSEHYGIEFNDMARQEASSMGFAESDARKYVNRLNRDNIAQIVVLESLSRPNRAAGRTSLCVVNTHLYSNHQRADVKLWQTMNLLREIQSFVVARDLALMICGDFNSEPESAVYEFITHGSLSSEHAALLTDSKIRVLPDLHNIIHELDLTSAMASALGKEPSFTNYTSKFKGTLDYIFYTPSRLRIMAATSIPEETDIRSVAGDGLPCTCYPSDHILLCCDVALINSGSGNILTAEPSANQHAGSGKMKGSRGMGK